MEPDAFKLFSPGCPEPAVKSVKSIKISVFIGFIHLLNERKDANFCLVEQISDFWSIQLPLLMLFRNQKKRAIYAVQ
jgi:hypothetical protein